MLKYVKLFALVTRSSKPRRATLEHNDSLSSAEEEDDDDDGFEILTAESLFSTLLSRVSNSLMYLFKTVKMNGYIGEEGPTSTRGRPAACHRASMG